MPAHFEMHYSTASAEEEEQEEAADDEEDDDLSFSLSGLLEEDAFVDPAMLSTALDDSISFTFSTENAPPDHTRECDPFDFTPPSSPLLKYVNASSAFGSPHAYDNCASLHNDEDPTENAALVPFKISGSWGAESSFQNSARHSESKRSFSFLTDLENGEEFSEESLMHFKGATVTEDLRICNGNEENEDNAMHDAGVAHDVDDEKIHMYNAQISELDREGDDQSSQTACCDGKNVGSVQMYTQSSADIEENSSDLFDILAHYDDNQHMDIGRNLRNPNQSTADSPLRFAGEGLLQPWSSSKLSIKSGKQQMNAERYDSQRISHDSTNILSHLHPFQHAPDHDIRDDFDRKPGKRASSRMQSAHTSALFSPSGVCSPTDTPICMPRKSSSSLFARRMMRNTSETSSLLVHAHRTNTSYVEAMPSPSSNGSAKSSNYIRTSSIGSTQSSGYSSSSGKYSASTPGSSRTSSKSRAHIAARWSLQQQMDAEPFTLLKKGEYPHVKPLREEDPNPQLHRKEDKMHMKQGVAYMHAQVAQGNKGKTDPILGAAVQHIGGILMSPSTSSSVPSPRSPVSWRSVLSLQPLNPSHVPLDHWELLGKPSNSRSTHSQRSSRSSGGSGGKEGAGGRFNIIIRERPSMSATTPLYSSSKLDRPPAFIAASNNISSGVKAGAGSSSKGTHGINPSPAANNYSTQHEQKLVKNRRGYYWALNPLHWFKQCRNDQKQVVMATSTTILEPCK